MFGKLPAACLPAFPPDHLHAIGTRVVCRYQLVPPRIAPDRRTPRAGRMSGQRRKEVLGLGAVVAATRTSPAGPQAWQTIALSPLPLPPGHIRHHPPRRRSLMNQVKRPATGWRNLLTCTRHRTSPAPGPPRRSPAHLTPGRQHRNKGAGGGDGGRQRLPPEMEGGRGWRQSPFAGRHGCEECSHSPYCLGSFVLLHTHTHTAPPPHRQKYWEQDRNSFVEGSPRLQKASCPRPAVRARLAHRPTLLLAPEGR